MNASFVQVIGGGITRPLCFDFFLFLPRLCCWKWLKGVVFFFLPSFLWKASGCLVKYGCPLTWVGQNWMELSSGVLLPKTLMLLIS